MSVISMDSFILFQIFALFGFGLSVPIKNNLIISLPDGRIQGTSYTTGNNQSYYGFQGIPYAAPPVGELRFEAPQPVEPWIGVWDATADRKRCVSIYYLDEPEAESEDCLHINVYTPNLSSEAKLPVMFWIYGGGFAQGNSSKSFYGPDFLIEAGVILVTMNYRATPLGFLSTGDEALPGNMGLKDQSLALKWTYKNIEYFGGNSQAITIFGASAGGASSGLHLLSKLSAGLFRAAIVESGSALTYWTIDQDPKTTADLIADGIPGADYKNDTQALKSFLKTRTVAEIINAANALPLLTQCWPVIEPESDNAFLTDSPYQLLENGDFSRVPIIIGISAEESLMFLKDLVYATILALLVDAAPSKLIPKDLQPNSSQTAEVVNRIRSIYLKQGETFATNLTAFAKYLTDVGFANGGLKQAELASQYVPVYLYQFAYSGRPIVPAFIDGAEKASHVAELPFIFNISGISETTNANDLLIQKQTTFLWTNFAKYLNPTTDDAEVFGNLEWPVLNGESKYLNINDTLEIRDNLKGGYFSKWKEIYEAYGQKPFVTF